MSSVTSVYAQVSGRVKFLLAVADVSGAIVPGLHSVSSSHAGSDIIDSATKVDVPIGQLLKDLGRQIVLYEEPLLGGVQGSPHLATYRQVQRMNGVETEGVNGGAPDGQGSYYETFYVCVSSADTSVHPVGVVRTG